MRRLPTTLVVSSALSAALVFSVGPSALAGSPRPEPKVTAQLIGGVPSVENYPWMGRGKFGCGASVISETWLVTAAHCLNGHEPRGSLFEARIGSKDKKEGGEVVPARKEFLHPNHPAAVDGKRKLYDIGLIKLKVPYKGGTVALPTGYTAPNTPTRLLGWGAQDTELTKFPRYLHELDTKVRDNSACDTASGIFMPGFEICTDNPQGVNGACSGDSGGPQITKVDGRWTLIGVTSRGGAVCGGSPSVYTDIFGYKSWILDTVRAEDGTLPPELAAWQRDTASKPTITPTPTSSPSGTPSSAPAPTTRPRPSWWPTRLP
ncbi:3-mercaptopyruvate sulfurtransferase [Platysternon megacephalum]|uniref:3-mercaptopyruvate sulfurtransferase n=1 Tax=Platysternon megacephalum TaxID=55544 RepID=A0A4D9DFC7_9SAUR|nr:3-mercaptopyruvate sulfurtransferase [Platysternon megacephalum]